MQSISQIILDVSRETQKPIINAVQFDGNTRKVIATILDNGVPFQMPDGVRATVGVERADGSSILYNELSSGDPAVVVSGNTAEITIASDALLVSGIGSASVNFYSENGEKLTTMNFLVNVHKSVVQDDSVILSEYYQLPMQKVEEATQEALDAAASASELKEYVIEPTNTNEDRTEEIREKLSLYNRVFFAPGNYLVSDTIVLPQRATVDGSGQNSVIMMDTGNPKTVFVCNGDNVVKNITIDGGLPSSNDEVGMAHGIHVPETSSFYQFTNVVGRGIPGAGIYVERSGYYSLRSTAISNCTFRTCGAGIYFGPIAEYSMVSNTSCTDCLYGCINNGGNNKFSACGFDGNRINFCIDGSNITGANNGHGSAVGCTFNHSTNAAVMFNACENGFTFAGCQFFDDVIRITDSSTVLFDGCQFRVSEFAISGGSESVIVNDGIFSIIPTITAVSKNRIFFNECYSISGEPIYINDRLNDFVIQKIRIPAGGSVTITLPASSFAMFATSATTAGRKSAALLWGGNATNSGLRAVAVPLLEGAEIAYAVGSTSGAYNTVTVSNSATSPADSVLITFVGKITYVVN